MYNQRQYVSSCTQDRDLNTSSTISYIHCLVIETEFQMLTSYNYGNKMSFPFLFSYLKGNEFDFSHTFIYLQICVLP